MHTSFFFYLQFRLRDCSSVYYCTELIWFIAPKCVYGCKDTDSSHLTFVLVRKYECEMNFVFFTSRNTKQNGKEDKTHFNMYRESISYFCWWLPHLFSGNSWYLNGFLS